MSLPFTLLRLFNQYESNTHNNFAITAVIEWERCLAKLTENVEKTRTRTN